MASTTYTLGICGSYLYACAFGSDSGGVWLLPLDAVTMDEGPGYVAYSSTCTSDTFSFSLQTVGGCTHPTLDSVIIVGLDPSEYQIIHTHNANAPDTSWVTVNPTQAGVSTFTVTARYVDNYNNVQDTSFTLTLNVSPAQKRLSH